MTALKTVSLAAALALAATALAANASPAGVWRTIDDNTGQARSLIRITEVKGELQGVVEKIFPQPGQDPAPVCRQCKGERKDKSILGMTILWGLKRDGDSWGGGEILDPQNGKTYRCEITVGGDGKSLKVRGFVGFSLFGRTQTWLRQE